MRRALAIFLLTLALLAPAAPARAQAATVPGSITGAGSPVPGCSAITAIANVVSGVFTCNPASVVNGSVSTAGRSILTIQDTISGSSATSNFLNITGTTATTLTASASAGLMNISTAGSSAQRIAGLEVNLNSGYTGGTANAAFYGTNSVVGNGGLLSRVYEASLGNAAHTQVGYYASGGTNGRTYGARFLIGNGTDPAVPTVGILAAVQQTGTSGSRIGGMFALGNVTPSDTADSAAVIADNSSLAAKIFEARDNGTAVFTIGDGGAITVASGAGQTTFSNSTVMIGNDVPLSFASTVNIGGFRHITALSPDSLAVTLGTLSDSLQVIEQGDVAFDFQNACTSGLGTAACTDPTLIVHSHNQDTGEFLSMAHDGKAGVIVGGNSTVLDGTIRLGGTVTLTESSPTNVLTIPVAVSTGTGGEIIYTVEAKDATNTQVRRGSVRYAVANNSSGTETCGVYGVDNAATVNPAETNDGSGAGAITSGTLTYAWSSDTSGTNSCVLKLNGVSSLTQTTFQIHYTVIQSGPGVPTGGD